MTHISHVHRPRYRFHISYCFRVIEDGIIPKNFWSSTYAVSAIVGKIKANTSREMRQRFPWIKTIYWRNEFWSVGFFSSTVGVNEDVIKRYVEFQEKVDTGKLQLEFGF